MVTNIEIICTKFVQKLLATKSTHKMLQIKTKQTKKFLQQSEVKFLLHYTLFLM